MKSAMNEAKVLNLGVVLKETGMKADTLRAWERRYKLPSPARSSGGHRLYSERDIATLRWLRDRQAEGMRISKAAELWRYLLSQGHDPLSQVSAAPVTAALQNEATLDNLRQSWVASCLKFDEIQADRVFEQALALYSLETVCFQLLQQGLASVGDLWYRGEASVHQEHYASSLAVRRLHALIAVTSPPTRPYRILIACPPHERHTFPLLLLALMLRRRGFHARYLGADVPFDRMLETVRQTRPNLVVFSAQLLHTAASLAEISIALLSQNLPVAFGGRIFNRHPGLAANFPGFFLGETTHAAVGAIERLVVSPTPVRQPASREPVYLRALSAFEGAQAHIESDLFNHFPSGRISPRILHLVNQNMARNIKAALSLGDISLLEAELDWVKGLLEHNTEHVLSLAAYLQAYESACRKHLNPDGKLIVDWISDPFRWEANT